ncbi:MAG: NAD-dependent epimerase/dehydratase family protein [Burkholderiales bacterium]|nr:NAD-dependent epimerase/dehydratase family protein [Burkholderiales bacterium]
MRLLILGGTGFIGEHQVRYALERGHTVTLFNRGQRAATRLPKVDYLVGDRDQNDYAALRGRTFDACIDNATLVPRWVRSAAALLAPHIGHYTLISTVSVYASDAEPDADEGAARQTCDRADAFDLSPADVRADMSLYGPLKALCEDEAMRQYDGRCAMLRPGLIVGPGDESDRFTYWPVRIAQGGEVLVPPRADPVQFIDVRDVAAWSVQVAEQRLTGAFNLKGPASAMTMGEFLDTIRSVVNPDAILREASREFLAAQQVNAWTDLPVWIPGVGETAGAHRRSSARALAAGLPLRPLSVTAADTLAWWRSLPIERQTKFPAKQFGLSAARERALLAAMG